MKLTLEQEKFTEGIPEIESLIKTYTVIDNILVQYKTEATKILDINTTRELIENVKKITSDLYDILNRINSLNTTYYINPKIIKKFRNPELDTTAFNAFLISYKQIKKDFSVDTIVDLQQAIFTNIKNAVDLILKYRNNKYYLPKTTKKILENISCTMS